MLTRGDFILDRWRTLIEQVLPGGCGVDLVSTTFTLYRRELQGPPNVPPSRNALGIQARPTKQDFEVIVANLPCLFLGANPKQDHWLVQPEGQTQEEMANLYTTYLDVREGDNLVVAKDGKTYEVDNSTDYGPVLRCFLNTGKAQL